MNNRNIDIDKAFSRLREESKPTPLHNLVEARETGALFALKQSASSKLLSAKLLWAGMGAVLVVSGGILYGVHSAQPKAAHASAHEIHTAESRSTAIPERESTPAPAGTEEKFPSGKATQPAPARATESPVPAHSAAAEQTQREAVAAMRAAHHRRAARHGSTTLAIQQNNNPTQHADSKAEQLTVSRKDSGHIGTDRAAGITAASYLYNPISNAELAYGEAFALLPTAEEFPLEWHSGNDRRAVSLTINSAALIADIVQFQGEVRISDDLSCSLILGLGNVAGRDTSSYSLLLAGAQAQYYALGDFSEGLQIGAQFLFSSTDFNAKNTFLYENGRVLSIIPYAGYKLALESGFTLNLQAGVGAATPVFISADATGSGNNTEYKWHVSTRLQFNVGWTL